MLDLNKKRKFALFRNESWTSFTAWWFTGYGTKQQIHSKKFDNHKEAEQWIEDNK